MPNKCSNDRKTWWNCIINSQETNPVHTCYYLCIHFISPSSPWRAPPTAAKLLARGRSEALNLVTSSNFCKIEDIVRSSPSKLVVIPKVKYALLINLTWSIYKVSFLLILSLTHKCYFISCFSCINQPQKNNCAAFICYLASKVCNTW